MGDVEDATLFSHGYWTRMGHDENQQTDRQLAVLEEVVELLGRKSRKKVGDLEEEVVVHHDVDVGAIVVGNEDGRESWDEEHMSDPSQCVSLALELLVLLLVNVSQLFPSVTL